MKMTKKTWLYIGLAVVALAYYLMQKGAEFRLKAAEENDEPPDGWGVESLANTIWFTKKATEGRG